MSRVQCSLQNLAKSPETLSPCTKGVRFAASVSPAHRNRIRSASSRSSRESLKQRKEMSAADAMYALQYDAVSGATDAQKVASIAGPDSGHRFGPHHILYRKLGHRSSIIFAVGSDFKIKIRDLDSAGMRVFKPNAELREHPVASFVPFLYTRICSTATPSGVVG